MSGLKIIRNLHLKDGELRILNRIDEARTTMLSLMMDCDEKQEGWRTARSILNVLDWVMSDKESESLTIIVD